LALTIIDALKRRDLFGAVSCYRDLSTWTCWLTYLRALYGIPFESGDLERFQKHTGRTSPRLGGYKESVCIVGRGAAKSRIAATIAAWEATQPGQHSGQEYAIVLAQDARAAQRALFSFVLEPYTAEGSKLAALVEKAPTVDTLTLTTGVTVAVYPTRAESVRSVRARVVCVDELAFIGSAGGRDEAREILTAIRPCLALPGGRLGRLLILSSPGPTSGLLHDLYKRHFRKDDSPVLVWQASAMDMNPTLSVDYLERSRDEDPVAYRSEVLGEFKVGTSSLFDLKSLEAAVVTGQREIAPDQCPSQCKAFFDGAGGKVDRAALAIAFVREGRVTIAALRAWPSPHRPASVIAEAADLLRAYKVKSVVSDAYGSGLTESMWQEQGIGFVRSTYSASDVWLDALPAVLSGYVSLPDPALSETARELIDEFLCLERRAGGDRDRVEAPRTATHHADLALACAGVISCFPRPKPRRAVAFSTDVLTSLRRPGFVEPDWSEGRFSLAA
jgi:hypothetical protein